MKNGQVPIKVFFLPIRSAKYPPAKGATIAPIPRKEPTQERLSVDGIVDKGLLSPSDDSKGNIEDVHPIQIPETNTGRFAEMAIQVNYGK